MSVSSDQARPETPLSHAPSAASTLSIIKLEKQARSLSVHWSDGRESEFHYLWLRDNCSQAFHPDTRERLFDLLSVSPDIEPDTIHLEEEALIIRWSEDGHTSRYPLAWLHTHCYSSRSERLHNSSYQSWEAEFVGRIPRAQYRAVLDDDKALYHWMLELDKHGLTIVEQMPDSQEAMITLANRIDYLRQTNFGTTFQVVSVESPINLAYTSIALPLHTDLPNQETPPGFQFLHCLANESTGGESSFVDGLRVAEELREHAPEQFKLLAEHPIPFRFHDDEHDIRHHHTVINLDAFGNIIELKYNAHIADVFDLPAAIMHDYYLAYRQLMTLVRDARFRIEIKLQAGQMVVFDNRRVLHGRNAFESQTGRRQLHGCYVDRTEFKSRLRVLGAQYRTTNTPMTS